MRWNGIILTRSRKRCSSLLREACRLTSYAGAGFGVGTAVALLLVAFFLYMLLRKNRYDDNRLTQKVKVGA